MAQIAHPQPHAHHLPSLGQHHGFLVAGLIALAALVAVVLVIAIGDNGGGGGTVSSTAVNAKYTAGPAAGTASAVSQVFRPQVRATDSLTTNVYPLERYEAGPTPGTAAAVSAATGAPQTDAFSGQKSLTTNVYPKSVPNSGPTTSTPDAVSEALSGQ